VSERCLTPRGQRGKVDGYRIGCLGGEHLVRAPQYLVTAVVAEAELGKNVAVLIERIDDPVVGNPTAA
jgi:hypothetical protein